MDEEPEGMLKIEYEKMICEMLKKCKDLVLLDLIFKILVKSCV